MIEPNVHPADTAAGPAPLDGLIAVESFFSAGITVAPMANAFGGSGATLFRYLPAMQDDWSGGLHLDAAPEGDDLRQALSTWQAFDAPGRLRWPAPAGAPVDQVVLATVASEGFVAAARPVLSGRVAPVGPVEVDGVAVAPINGDIKDWAGFEVLARWIDLDVDPDRWKWRATRVRHLVEGGRGRAWLARTTMAPVGACVVLDPPDHRRGAVPTIAVVVHQAHRASGVARALLAAAGATVDGPVTVLGDGPRHLVPAAESVGLREIATLVEVRRPTDSTDRKA